MAPLGSPRRCVAPCLSERLYAIPAHSGMRPGGGKSWERHAFVLAPVIVTITSQVIPSSRRFRISRCYGATNIPAQGVCREGRPGHGARQHLRRRGHRPGPAELLPARHQLRRADRGVCRSPAGSRSRRLRGRSFVKILKARRGGSIPAARSRLRVGFRPPAVPFALLEPQGN